jgi:hypothetical protein
MYAQRLTGPPSTTVAEAVTALQAIQAQSAPAARLAIRARTRGLVAADVDASIAGREIVRTWLMRGTLHLVPASDVRWLVELYRPILLAAGMRRRLQLGLDDQLCREALPVIEAALRGGPPLTRAELLDRLAAKGIRLDPKTQAPIHLIAHAAHHGLVVRGPDRGARDEPTYVHLDEWVPAADPPDDPVTELATTYLDGHGPADEPDFRAWSGLPAAQTKAAWVNLSSADLRKADSRCSDASPAPTPARLLGHFDEYLLGYRGRDLILDPAYANRIHAGGGMIQPAIVVDGRVAGTWKTERQRGTVTVALDPFEPLPARVRKELDTEAEDVVRFLQESAGG